MNEDHIRPTSGHAPRVTADEDFSTQGTDPKFARESFTMRRMQPWQIVALAIVVALAAAGVLFYI